VDIRKRPGQAWLDNAAPGGENVDSVTKMGVYEKPENEMVNEVSYLDAFTNAPY
jgi:hypothetical protein